MKNIGIIGAMEEEIVALKGKMKITEEKNMVGLTFYVGTYAGKNLVLVKSGIGKVNAAICAQALIDRFDVEKIIMVGVAGSLSAELRVGDIILSEDAVEHDMDTSPLGDPIGTIPRMEESYFKADQELLRLALESAKEVAKDYRVLTGRVASGDQFICTEDAKAKIRETVGGMCAEMEGAAVAHTCYLNNTPFLIIRAISDGAGEDAGLSFEEFCVMAAQRGSVLVENLIGKL
ncbi:5'-methylthioadenosine/adenosylhomocysteine nucleosidase [Chakrabartyella piscis]|uniref:5'-methylthioadenosine/adenosylhomocysteine nucleosidase n=1 Tax=Chakrabartyella piscis TaxID=2918914 RepID=UPI00295893A0|nr:5'-methylthioadenosine/adenosylhomocysteine nucleosidase [Chakrabartyella piscis]